MGTEKAAYKIIEAGDLHAIAFRNWLEKQPGERPRFSRNESKSRAVLSGIRPKRKKEGLESTLSNATIWKKFAALRRMYRVLIASDLGISVNPFDTDRVTPPPKDSGRKRPTEMIELSRVQEILDSPDTTIPKGIRDKAILSVLFGGGLRRSEAASLRIGDVRMSPQGTTFLYLRSTKAKKDAEQAIPEWAAQAVKDLLSIRKAEGANTGDYLFVSYRGQGGTTPTSEPISHSGIYKLFKAYCLINGHGYFKSPHSARATAITKLLSDGLPHRVVQEFSRHSSIQMVEVYDKRRIGVDENPAKSLNYSRSRIKK